MGAVATAGRTGSHSERRGRSGYTGKAKKAVAVLATVPFFGAAEGNHGDKEVNPLPAGCEDMLTPCFWAGGIPEQGLLPQSRVTPLKDR